MRSPGRTRARALARAIRSCRDERGFTMIEVAVAILIFAVLVVGMTVTMSSSLNLVRNDRNRSVAANLAAQEMDTARSTDFPDLPIGQYVHTEDVGGVSYTVTRESEWVTKDALAGACDAPSGSRPAYLRIDVSVTWQAMTGVRPVAAHTIVTPPVGAYDPNSGHIAVSVVDRDGQSQGGVPISVAGPQNESQITNSDGCAFFAFLPAGSYTVAASSLGYVDLQGVATPTQAASVVVAATTSIQFQYDQAATLALTPIGKDLGSAAPPDVAVTLFNTHLLPTGMVVFPGVGVPRTIADLFPYADGYEAWAGSCADADPASYEEGSRGDPIPTEPGTTTAANVLMPEIRVTIQHFDSDLGAMVPVPGKQIDAAHSPGDGCASGESHSIGQTDANGQIVFALPYGTWTVTVDGGAVWSGSVTLSPASDPGDGDGSWPYDIAVET
ncbi:MAG: prepilin-type N-terminal cleavage/methylation domain-containing protein [Actinomycetota bacterium]